MIKIENECVGCPPEIGCLGSACPKREVAHYYCDQCGEEFDTEELYNVEGKMLCGACTLGQYTTVREEL